MTIFGPLVWATTSPETVTLARVATSVVIFGPSTRRTAGRVTAAPGSPSSFSISMTSPSATLYCLPPVLTIAYIVDAPSCLSWCRGLRALVCCCRSQFGYCWVHRRFRAADTRQYHPLGHHRVSDDRYQLASGQGLDGPRSREGVRPCDTNQTRATQSALRSSVPNDHDTRRRAGGANCWPGDRDQGGSDSADQAVQTVHTAGTDSSASWG